MKSQRPLLLAACFVLLPCWSGGLCAADAPASPHSEGKNAKPDQALEQARDHLLNALRSLREAGRLTYEERMPELRDKSSQALEETQRLLRDLERRLPKLEEKPSTPPTAPVKPEISPSSI
ncbi:MAG: hypothetical protein HQM03_09030 [Magnetococcales bacterium]|nr:hypothetical protein [Magnetococcales bacterium]